MGNTQTLYSACGLMVITRITTGLVGRQNISIATNGVGDILCKSTVTNMVAVRNFASVKKKNLMLYPTNLTLSALT